MKNRIIVTFLALGFLLPNVVFSDETNTSLENVEPTDSGYIFGQHHTFLFIGLDSGQTTSIKNPQDISSVPLFTFGIGTLGHGDSSTYFNYNLILGYNNLSTIEVFTFPKGGMVLKVDMDLGLGINFANIFHSGEDYSLKNNGLRFDITIDYTIGWTYSSLIDYNINKPNFSYITLGPSISVNFGYFFSKDFGILLKFKNHLIHDVIDISPSGGGLQDTVTYVPSLYLGIMF